jgi:uncharacterized protein
MLKQLFLFITGGLLQFSANAQVSDYPFRSVAFTQVKLTDSFWMPRIRNNHLVTIPTSFERCESTGRVRNFEMAAARSGKFCTTFPFDDTDIYKTIEGASFSISLIPDKRLEDYMDILIEKIGKAQEPDGYIYTARTIDPLHPHSWAGMNRWEKERDMSHELYNSGHLYEAAAAHYAATGKRNLLDIALKNADLVCSVFGDDKLHVAPGHQVVEMGLVKLYRITGKREYLQTAKFFIEERGRYAGYNPKDKDPFKNGSYWQDHIPVTQQREAIGHSVRAGYLYAAVADIAALTGDKALLTSIDSIWENLVSKKLYVQGGAGAVSSGERYGDNYELPNATAYNETCASIANVYWNHRMFMLHGHAKYMDVLERILYNGLISGIGLDGKSFFYSNAMQVKNSFGHSALELDRSGWFECSCCPTNLTRLIPSIPGYMYAQKGNDLYINLFINSAAKVNLDGKQVEIEQQNNYPWEGNLVFLVKPDRPNTSFSLKVRIPGWAGTEVVPSDLYRFDKAPGVVFSLKVNGIPVPVTMDNGYAVISRNWNKGDKVEVLLPMEVRRIKANEKVKDDIGKTALQRGPLVYCAEWADNGGKASNLILPPNAVFSAAYQSSLLNGVVVLSANALAVETSAYEVKTVNRSLKAIPYYSWANRGIGEMTIWLPEQIRDIDILSDLPPRYSRNK